MVELDIYPPNSDTCFVKGMLKVYKACVAAEQEYINTDSADSEKRVRVMGNSSRQVLSRKKTSITTKYAMGIAVMFILESVLIVALARIWLTWNQVGYVVVVYIALAILITYWLFLSPAYIPSYINEEALTLTYGHEFKLLIPMDTIDSIENTKLKLSMMFPFGVVKEPKLDVLFVVYKR